MKHTRTDILSTFLWILFAFLAILTGFYPGLYFLLDRNFSLLAYKDHAILANLFWNIAFYTHILTGGLSLLIGWTQFLSRLRLKSPVVHRNIGKVYTFSSLLSSVAGLYLTFFATGGVVSHVGFTILAIFWFYTTIMTFINARNNRILQHGKMAFYSYAACFAAVTLRLWLQLLLYSGMDFIAAYRIVAWLSWLPNIIAADFLWRKKHKTAISL